MFKKKRDGEEREWSEKMTKSWPRLEGRQGFSLEKECAVLTVSFK